MIHCNGAPTACFGLKPAVHMHGCIPDQEKEKNELTETRLIETHIVEKILLESYLTRVTALSNFLHYTLNY